MNFMHQGLKLISTHVTDQSEELSFLFFFANNFKSMNI